MERRIEPALADIRNECLEAHHHGQLWRARRLQLIGVVTIVKVLALVTLEHEVGSLLRSDATTRSALLRLAALFIVVVTMATVALASVPFNTMPVPRPMGAQELLYLIPQALPIALPVGLMFAIVSGLRTSLNGRLAVWILAAAVSCSVVSFVTLGWWAPASNQVFRVKVTGREMAKGDNELTLGELGTRIEAIRAFDPAAPARRLSVLYHARWALSVTPLVLAMFALALSGRRRRTTVGGDLITALLLSWGFVLLLVWTNHLAFRGSVPPLVGAWLPNLTFVGVTAAAMLWSLRRRAGALG
jgi:lipopolysaccharide export LptBFGC system permease protein LptF